MKVIKMRMVNTPAWESAYKACVNAFGCIGARKRSLIWIACFNEMDDIVIRETLVTEGGSTFAGYMKPERFH